VQTYSRIGVPGLLAALLLVVTVTTRAAIYSEVGDAGDRLAPQDVIGSEVNRIDGTIGAGNPATGATGERIDAFRFFFAVAFGILAALRRRSRAKLQPTPSIIRPSRSAPSPSAVTAPW
jgi:hypothetical protein